MGNDTDQFLICSVCICQNNKNKHGVTSILVLRRAMVIVVKNLLIGIKHSDDLYMTGFQERDVDRE